jgi:MFS family permease
LRSKVFRSLWIAGVVSNIGTWMQTVGAQWLLVGEPNASTLVALVQTASSLPVLILGLPAGVLADVFDRRRLMIAAQVFQGVVAAVLAVLTMSGHVTPALLLTFTFLLGCGSMIVIPAFMATIPELVPRRDIPAASALGGMSMNLARAIGPALAGIVVAWSGAAATFALNAVTFFAFAVVLLVWRRPADAQSYDPEPLGAALRAGTRWVAHAPVVKRMLLRGALFVIPGTALWALLPVAANRLLGLDSAGYGLLLAALGAGAVLGALALPAVRTRLNDSALVAAAGVIFGGCSIVVALGTSLPLVLTALVPAGMAWIGALATLNAGIQLFLPGWVRARGLSFYQVVLFGGMAVAAVAWGLAAQATTIQLVLVVAGGVMVLGAVTVVWWPLMETSHMDRTSVTLPEPQLELEPTTKTGPVQVSITYFVPAEDVEAFLGLMDRLRRSRRRTGAVRWELYREGERPERFVEQFVVSTWDEHLRQHSGRFTVSDREVEEQVQSFSDGPTEVVHLFPPETPEAADDG